MKNSITPLNIGFIHFMGAALVVVLVCGTFIYGYKSSDVSSNMSSVTESIEFIKEPESKGFRYRGLLLDVDSTNGTEINIGPQHLYKMGFHDAVNGYPLNIRYSKYYQYRRGFRDGDLARKQR